jgi:dipeptidyl aminopeptidase/acylaminoacyl peptidase
MNALQDADADFFPFTVDHMSGTGSLDVADHGIIFQTNEPELDEETKLQHWVLWYVPIPDFTATPRELRKIEVPGLNGNFSSPVFSPDGKSAAFLSTRDFQVDEFYNRIFMMPSFTDPRVLEISPLLYKEGKLVGWDLDPQSLLWSNDSKSIYVIAEEEARVKLWLLRVPDPIFSFQVPVGIHIKLVADATSGSVSSVFPVSNDPKDSRILVNRSSFTDSGSCYIVDRDSNKKNCRHLIRKHVSHHTFGLSPSQVSSISFNYRDGYDVTAWVIKPSFFSPSKKYPLAFLIHGGPQGSWADSWSTRWNPMVWAEQGYVVVLPNP